jgi:hypothetical protein
MKTSMGVDECRPTAHFKPSQYMKVNGRSVAFPGRFTPVEKATHYGGVEG